MAFRRCQHYGTVQRRRELYGVVVAASAGAYDLPQSDGTDGREGGERDGRSEFFGCSRIQRDGAVFVYGSATGCDVQLPAGFDHIWGQRQPRQRDDDGADGSCNRKRSTAAVATGKWDDCAGRAAYGSRTVRRGASAQEAYAAAVLACAERGCVGRGVRGDDGMRLLAEGFNLDTDSGRKFDGAGGGQRSVRVLGEHDCHADCAVGRASLSDWEDRPGQFDRFVDRLILIPVLILG